MLGKGARGGRNVSKAALGRGPWWDGQSLGFLGLGMEVLGCWDGVKAWHPGTKLGTLSRKPAGVEVSVTARALLAAPQTI